MREFHLSDLWAIAAGLLIFLALITWEAWWPLLYAIVWSLLQRYRQRPIMSPLPKPAPPTGGMEMEQRSYAVERGTEPPGTEDGNGVPDIVEQLEALDDDALLDILSQLRNPDGEYRYAESRIAKFIPGRVEDRLTQIRETRGTEKPLPPGRVLRVRDNAGERVIPFVEGRKAKGQ